MFLLLSGYSHSCLSLPHVPHLGFTRSHFNFLRLHDTHDIVFSAPLSLTSPDVVVVGLFCGAVASFVDETEASCSGEVDMAKLWQLVYREKERKKERQTDREGDRLHAAWYQRKKKRFIKHNNDSIEDQSPLPWTLKRLVWLARFEELISKPAFSAFSLFHVNDRIKVSLILSILVRLMQPLFDDEFRLSPWYLWAY